MLRIYLIFIIIMFLCSYLGWYFAELKGAEIGVGLSLLFIFVSYFFCGKLALFLSKARPLKTGEIPKIDEIVFNFSKAAGITPPKVYIIDSDQPNIFSTGRSPNHGTIAITIRILELLEISEIEAVIAREISHIKNRDTLVLTITASLAGMIGLFATFVYMTIGRNSQNRRNPIADIIILFLAPLTASIIQICVSRNRVYKTDEEAANLCKNPLALANALRLIDHEARLVYNVPAERNPGTAHMYIVNPLQPTLIQKIFSTHPHITKRVDRLVAIHEETYGKLSHNQEYFKELEYRKLPWYKKIFQK